MAETGRTTGQVAAVSDNGSTLGEPPRADQPWDHLGDVLKFVITAFLALAATVGCSAKVETESSNWTSPASVSTESQDTTGEKARTTVEVDLLQTRPSEPPPSPKPPTSGDSVIINLGDGDIHLHEAPARAESNDEAARPRDGLNTRIGWPSTYGFGRDTGFPRERLPWPFLQKA